MNIITNVLRTEHRLIERAAACLDRVAEEALESGNLCLVTAIDLLEFFEYFVDAGHQEKEEHHLFPALRRQGKAERRITKLHEDHRVERQVLQELQFDLERATNGSDSSRVEFACAARAFGALQREHVAEEDLFLLPLTEELLDEKTLRSVLVGFRRVDASLTRSPREFAELVEKAARRMGSIVRIQTSPLVSAESRYRSDRSHRAPGERRVNGRPISLRRPV